MELTSTRSMTRPTADAICSNVPESKALMEEGPQIATRMSSRERIVVLLLVISVVVNYVDRSNLSLAVPLIQQHFALSPLQIDSLLSAFYWTYALLQISGIAGWLSDRFPVGWVLVGGYVLWSGATVVTGLVSSFSALYIARLLLGVGESVSYPCYSRIFAELPQEHRGRANALIDAGTKLGPAMGAFVGGLLLVHLGWRLFFVVLGAGGLLWLLPWIKVMPRFGRRVETKSEAAHPSIVQLLQVKCAWGTFLGHFCGNYFYYFMLAWLPHYLVGEEKMSIGSMSRLISTLFLLIATSSLLTGWISDRLIMAGSSPTRVRRAAVVGGMGVSSSLLALAVVHRNLPLDHRDCCGMCGVWGLCFEPLGDHTDASRHSDGRAMEQLAEWIRQPLRDRRSLGHWADRADQWKLALGVCPYRWRGARRSIFLGAARAARGAGAVGRTQPYGRDHLERTLPRP
jgi:MFS family permease